MMTGIITEIIFNNTNNIYNEYNNSDNIYNEFNNPVDNNVNTTAYSSIQASTANISSTKGTTLRYYILVFSVLYLFGCVGNLAALCLLFSKSSPRNPRLRLMLRCLAINDLIAMIGMWLQLILKSFKPAVSTTRWYCGSRVVWRAFGLGSGCIVCVMAIDRWIALSRPFFYHRHVTVGIIKRALATLWIIDLTIVCLPFFGFGVYYKNQVCIRYKLAEHPVDIIYSYVYSSFGLLLCLGLVLCNVAVMKVLLAPVDVNRKSHVLVRRISRNKDLTYSASTSEELAFAKVMGLLCLVFILCWIPQLITVPIAHLYPKSPKILNVINYADGIYALHFTLDPYFYVLQRWSWFRSLCCKKPNSRGNSVKTSNELCSL